MVTEYIKYAFIHTEYNIILHTMRLDTIYKILLMPEIQHSDYAIAYYVIYHC